MPKINWDGRSAGNGAWVYEGNELKPKYGVNSSNTWVIQGNVVKPDFGSNSSNTYDINKAPIAVIIGQVCLKLW